MNNIKQSELEERVGEIIGQCLLDGSMGGIVVKELLTLIQEQKEEVARDCLKIVDEAKDEHATGTGYLIGWGQAQARIADVIAKKYQLWEKYKLKPKEEKD